ncbi:hypothetical protein ElyMa_003905800 [Elysia marginata]|uniref:Uncharacterized protein n=1 Tax=Elysia marginata TaxID=1093978 RepID=A0AAV4FNR1_9GAST|nr:hypothetical protein ElyMa_003905800 [Elysia marginata]
MSGGQKSSPAKSYGTRRNKCRSTKAANILRPIRIHPSNRKNGTTVIQWKKPLFGLTCSYDHTVVFLTVSQLLCFSVAWLDADRSQYVRSVRD